MTATTSLGRYQPRYDRCDSTCTTDCGHCKGAGKPAAPAPASLTARNRGGLRIPATINPDDRDKWRGHAASYAHLGRSIEMFAHDAVDYATFVRGRHAARTISAAATDAEAAAFRAELPNIFPEPAAQPLPVVRLSSQAELASVRGGL